MTKKEKDLIKQMEQEAWEAFKEVQKDPDYTINYVTMLRSEWIGIRTVAVKLGIIKEMER